MSETRREHVRVHPWHEARAFSSAVRTTGGTTIWLAGMTPVDENRTLVGAGDFDRQVEQVFENMRQVLARAGGTLADLVTMTVFVTDIRLGDRFIELRKKILGRDFPASALIGVSQLAAPGFLVEVQAVAVV
jgi:enamine deaminase RidA (YjgF/YER057c/UK114 family)